jgi:DNA invertase Pin-like site-specific DNA recombinase
VKLWQWINIKIMSREKKGRNKKIYEYYRKTKQLSYGQIARIKGVGKQTVYDICKRYAKAETVDKCQI